MSKYLGMLFICILTLVITGQIATTYNTNNPKISDHVKIIANETSFADR